MKKKFYYFLLLFPIIDFITSIATWNNYTSIGTIIKGCLLLGSSIYILTHNKNQKEPYIIFGLIIIYSLIHIALIGTHTISTLIKIFYFPVLLYFFYVYQNKYINRRIYCRYFIIFSILYLLPYPFNLGHNISEIYPNKDLYLSFFYVGNEIVNIFILLIPLSIEYIKSKKSIYLIITILTIILISTILTTKTLYLALIIIIIYFIHKYKEYIIKYLKRHIKVSILLIITLISSLCILMPRVSLYKNITTSLSYYGIDTPEEVFSYDTLNHIIFSNRLSFLEDNYEEYKNSSPEEKIFGMKKIEQYVEIDIFDIFFHTGILGLISYIIIMTIVLKRIKLKNTSKFSLILLLIISNLSGHVLLSPMVTTYLSLLSGINKGAVKDEILDQESIKTHQISFND